ncbi:uncharacterized protein FIBRA_00901 [Fibroporia radiculosa]|uniref:Uncharacterized protein n=1 Tax=Fibroporia radiculosa TaxID=599839 RepID=J4H0T2_9APHY|nr:uncharacterized protein FIBRA_00901 [Fibroporia radiculosa]CCL98894.1 predicted protein [Fibroporia radiculosa]
MTVFNIRLSRFGGFLKFTCQVIWTVILIFASYIFRRPLSGHALTIGRISPSTLTLHDVRYSGALYDHTYTYTFTSPSISAAFHLPNQIYPRWFTFTSKSILYTSMTADISVSKLDVTFWVFPYLFKRTAGPWLNVILDDFVIRVHKSSATPYWIQRLRQNLVAAILTGEIFRLDHGSARVQLAGISEKVDIGELKKCRSANQPTSSDYSNDGSDADDGDDDTHVSSKSGSSNWDDRERETDFGNGHAKGEPCVKMPPRRPPPFEDMHTDELRVSAVAQQLHLYNAQGRVYTFQRVDAQLRRDWDTDRGSFVMIAEDGRWERVPWPYQREFTPWWTQFFTSMAQFPLDLWHTLCFPMSAVNLYVPRADIMFDEFRIRDAALLVQSFTILREKSIRHGINWGDLFLDAALQIFVSP